MASGAQTEIPPAFLHLVYGFDSWLLSGILEDLKTDTDKVIVYHVGDLIFSIKSGKDAESSGRSLMILWSTTENGKRCADLQLLENVARESKVFKCHLEHARKFRPQGKFRYTIVEL